tara:strand:+ start:855 stop:1205 length:351 start_codon:yes stop_codon:yes gene_type:complete
MAIYTYQISQARRLKDRDVVFIDSTVKSGYVQLAPRWDMVMGHKKGLITDAFYTEQYLAILNYYWFHDPDFFTDLLQIENIAVGCYCAPGRFCHRHLLANFLSQLSHHTLEGEITP